MKGLIKATAIASMLTIGLAASSIAGRPPVGGQVPIIIDVPGWNEPESNTEPYGLMCNHSDNYQEEHCMEDKWKETKTIDKVKVGIISTVYMKTHSKKIAKACGNIIGYNKQKKQLPPMEYKPTK